jgi:hypothetical protein
VRKEGFYSFWSWWVLFSLERIFHQVLFKGCCFVGISYYTAIPSGSDENKAKRQSSLLMNVHWQVSGFQLKYSINSVTEQWPSHTKLMGFLELLLSKLVFIRVFLSFSSNRSQAFAIPSLNISSLISSIHSRPKPTNHSLKSSDETRQAYHSFESDKYRGCTS